MSFVDQHPTRPNAEEMARIDMVTLSGIVNGLHPNANVSTSPAEALEAIVRDGIDYGIGQLSAVKTAQKVAYAGSIIYVQNRLDDLDGGEDAVSGSAIGADLIDFVSRLGAVTSIRRNHALRQIRNELDNKRAMKYPGAEKVVLEGTVSVLNDELTRHNREAALLTGGAALAGVMVFSWWKKRR